MSKNSFKINKSLRLFPQLSFPANPENGEVLSYGNMLWLYNGSSWIDLLTDSSPTIADMEMTGIKAWGGSGNYYSIAGANFTVARAGSGYINNTPITWAGGETVTLTAGKTYFIGYSATNTLVATDFSTIFSATRSQYQSNLEDYMHSHVVLFEVWYDGIQMTVTKEDHEYAYETEISVHQHFTVGNIYTSTGGIVSVLSSANRTIQTAGDDMLDDHGLVSRVYDSGGLAIDVDCYYKNAGGTASRLNRRAFTTAGFTVTPTPGAVYRDSGSTFQATVLYVASNVMYTWQNSGTGTPAPSATLTKVSGTGDATVTYSSFTNIRVVPSIYLSSSIPTPLAVSGNTNRFGIFAIYALKDDKQTPNTTSPVTSYMCIPSATTYTSASNAANSLGAALAPDTSQFVMPTEIIGLEPVLTGFVIIDGNTRIIPTTNTNGFVNGVRSYRAVAGSVGLAGSIAVANAVNVSTDTTSFTGNLSNSDVNVQLALNTLSAKVPTSFVVRVSTLTFLPANTYNNGTNGVGATLTANANGSINTSGIDGVTNLAVGDRILVKFEGIVSVSNSNVSVAADTITQAGHGLTEADPLLFFGSSPGAAPVIANGSLISFNNNPVTTASASNLLTFTTASAHGMTVGSMVLVSIAGLTGFNGLSASDLNLTKPVFITSATQFTMESPTTATGSGAGGGASGTWVKGLVPAFGQTFFAKNVSGSTFSIAATSGGAVLDLLATNSTAAGFGFVIMNANGGKNGIYTLTQVGDSTHPWIMTRATDFDTIVKIFSGVCITVQEGLTQSAYDLQLETAGAITLATGPGSVPPPTPQVYLPINYRFNRALDVGANNIGTTVFNGDITIAPNGTGAFKLYAYNGSVVGMPRGINAVDLQMSRTLFGSVASGAYSVIAGGQGNTAGGLGSFVAGISNTIYGAYGVALGAYNNDNGQGGLIVGQGAQAGSGLEFAIGNNTSAVAPSVDNVHFRVDGLNSNVHIGRYTNQAANPNSTNILCLHARDLNTQLYYIGLRAPTTLAATTTFVLPSADGTAGQALKTDGSANLGWVSLARTAKATWITSDGVTKTVTHNWNTTDVKVEIIDLSDFSTIMVDSVTRTVNTVVCTASVAPGSSGFRILINEIL